MKKKSRWLKSVIAAAQDSNVPLPFQRGNRRPIAVRLAVPARPRSLAAR